MTDLLTAVAAGLVAASFYTIFGLGLAIVYRVTQVLNFTHGVVGSVAGYVTYSLLAQELPYWVAALLAIVVGSVLSALIYLCVVHLVPNRSAEAIGILTLGIAIVVQGLLLAIYGGDPRALPEPVTSGTWFTIGDYGVSATTAVAVGAAAVTALAIGFSLYRTRFGLAVRAVSEGSLTATMHGINPTVVRTFVWGVAGATAAVTALLVTPSNFLDPTFLTLYLLVAFVAVVLGGFESVAGVVLGAVVFGIVQNLVATYVTSRLTATISFLTIVLVLYFLPKGLLGKTLPRVAEPHVPRTRRRFGVPRAWRAALTSLQPSVSYRSPLRASNAVLLMPVLFAVVFILAGRGMEAGTLILVATMACYLIAALGVDLIYGYSGQLSLGQSGFMLAGAYVSVIIQRDLGVPYILSLVVAAVVSALAGALFGWPAARLAGVYLAVATLGFALAVPELAAFFDKLTGGDIGTVAPFPASLASGPQRNLQIYTFAVIVAALVAIFVLWLGRSGLGREWKAVRENDVAAAASGVNVSRLRVLAFALGAGLSGLAGALLASITGYLSPGSFTLWDSIYLVVAVVIGGRASVLGCAIGAAFVVGIPYVSSGFPALPSVALGGVLILVLLLRPRGVKDLLLAPADKLVDAIPLGRARRTGDGPPGAAPPRSQDGPPPARRRNAVAGLGGAE